MSLDFLLFFFFPFCWLIGITSQSTLVSSQYGPNHLLLTVLPLLNALINTRHRLNPAPPPATILRPRRLRLQLPKHNLRRSHRRNRNRVNSRNTAANLALAHMHDDHGHQRGREDGRADLYQFIGVSDE
ncbi:uncharacterized protein APUU_31606A [Aspergillus puulaauensis]|uniref:Uncharacterized protein n=1 Tax=Aspergillus puulaauensis TaxID=1220207 RepID=A0A7R8ALK3_9EURO|nr:uncharacterized protein APUU_31606A [Aspergillus puulaauensis]BCS23381.1 hypothetical protein APUU_31606A [Aspergillus puulaauensis]